MNTEYLLLSLSPDKLDVAHGRDHGIELKFDWEHRDLLLGDRSLAACIDEAGIDPDRIASVHVPPGTETRGDEVGMALTPANRGTIVDFVHDQLDVVPEAYLTAHPPKDFEYVAQLELIAEIASVTGREISVENTSVESDWYSPEAMAFIAYVTNHVDRFDDIYLTIDSGHLPTENPQHCQVPLDVDEAAIEELRSRIERSGYEFPDDFEESLRDRFEDRESELLGDSDRGNQAERIDSEFLPLLKTCVWLKAEHGAFI
jgi:hypothetical protein